jgi:hypothetical protein
MATFSGSYTPISAQGVAGQPLSCRLEFDKETLTLVPVSGPSLSIDLGDIDEFTPQDYELALTLYSGEKIHLSKFGKTFQDLTHDLLEAYRGRLVQCLLLNDLEEVDRFEGVAEYRSPDRGFTGPAEFRLYQSNLAVLPQGHTGLQWRLAEIESMTFDDSRYAAVLKSCDESLIVSRLAKRTGEFMEKLQRAASDITEKSAVTVRSVFPFLVPDQFRRAAEMLKEGRVAHIDHLTAMHPKTAQALSEKVVSAKLKPCFDYLSARSGSDGFFAGFKLIRKEEAEEEPAVPPEEAEAPAGGSEAIPDVVLESAPPDLENEDGTEVLYWFLFPLRTQVGSVPRMAAWETTSRSGRATYFFRLFSQEEALQVNPSQASSAVEQAMRRLNRGLLLLNFRREPIYLPDDSLALQSRYRRYAIAARKIPVVRYLRSAFIGRAIHNTQAAWQKQVQQKINSCR